MKQKGFTLLELLIVIAIIGILATLLMTNFVGIKQRARDGQRKSNLRQMQSALELYRADQGSYFTTVTMPSCNGPMTANSTTYMSKIPCDALNTTTPYEYASDGIKYCIRACLENGADQETDATTGQVCTSGIVISDCPSGTYNYTLLSP